VNATSASRAEAFTATPSAQRVLVWDAPVRVFHWLAVLCFAGAWITAESERWRLLHVTLGYTMAGLVAFRLVWGLIGTRHARFANFVRGPRAVMRYLGSLLRGRPEHHVGHNPAGALAIVGLLGLVSLVSVTGWAAYNEVWGEWAEDWHEGVANALMALVVVHVAAVALSSWLHHENLVGAMVSGRKPGPPRDAIAHAWRSVAALMLAAVLAFWWWQWRAPIGAAPLDGGPAAVAKNLESPRVRRDDDD
jgi:cytochrome b